MAWPMGSGSQSQWKYTKTIKIIVMKFIFHLVRESLHVLSSLQIDTDDENTVTPNFIRSRKNFKFTLWL